MLPEQAPDGVCVGLAFPGESLFFVYNLRSSRRFDVIKLGVFNFKIPAIPEDIFFTNEFTEVAKLEDSSTTAAGLVSEIFIPVDIHKFTTAAFLNSNEICLLIS